MINRRAPEIIDREGWRHENAIQILVSDHTYKYPSYPSSSGNNAHQGIFDTYEGSYNSTVSVSYSYTDVGLRVRSGAATLTVGAVTLHSGNKLRIRKGGTTYGVPLISTSASEASGIVIYDGSVVKSIPKVV